MDVNGKLVDLEAALPLRILDWIELEKRGVPFNEKMTTVAQLSEVLVVVLMRSNPLITREEVLELPLTHPVAVAAIERLGAEGARAGVPRPTSTSSTSSLPATAGAGETTGS